jgi:hypothetical protein
MENDISYILEFASYLVPGVVALFFYLVGKKVGWHERDQAGRVKPSRFRE